MILQDVHSRMLLGVEHLCVLFAVIDRTDKKQESAQTHDKKTGLTMNSSMTLLQDVDDPSLSRGTHRLLISLMSVASGVWMLKVESHS